MTVVTILAFCPLADQDVQGNQVLEQIKAAKASRGIRGLWLHDKVPPRFFCFLLSQMKEDAVWFPISIPISFGF